MLPGPLPSPVHAATARTSSRRRRALLASAIALALGSASALPAARAALSFETRGAGLALLEPLAASDAGRAHAVLLNGQRLLFSSRLTQRSVGEVLDAFEFECQERWLAARHGDGRVGQGACFRYSGARSVPGRLWDFVRDGDLSSLGQARYVLARRAPGDAGTHVLELWAPGALSLRALLDGPDATSREAEPVPPPPGAEPLLEARVEGEPQAVRLYTSAEEPRVLLERYALRLLASGFEAVSAPWDAAAPHGDEARAAAETRAFLSSERAALVSASRVGSQTLLARVEIARPRLASLPAEAR